MRKRPEALLVDFDGVLRVWDAARTAAVEQKYGLPPGALMETAFDWARLRPALVGEVTDAEWMAGVGAALGAPDAVAEWQSYRGEVCGDVLQLIRDVRAAGHPVALATNATDRLAADLAELGLTGELDAVVNSSEIGAPKPTREFFAVACAAVGRPPDRCLLVDDDDRQVLGARAAGVSAYRWTGPEHLGYLRAAFGLPKSVAN
ncbi:MAG: HAD-IA family hydrolase [Micromonosporaceae bacterium]|jgi:putative hydrolase of the HAD superfamily|nr:HAD-IA family hydrolase [Micromonosporaceae bacterium]